LRDIQRQLGDIADDSLRQRVEAEIALVDRLLQQKPKDKRKLYALHEPEVDCISKGKARVRYEFGTKVSVATTHKEGFVVGMRSMPGNPYDGHTLREALEQVEILTGTRPKRAFVDRGYRGHGDLHRRAKARDDPGAQARPAPAQRHRADDRPHENGWPPRPLRPEGPAWRCAPCRPVRLRPQHPDDPGPPQGALGRNPGDADGHLRRDRRAQRCEIWLQSARGVMFSADE
jgi:transposase, IS5 family